MDNVTYTMVNIGRKKQEKKKNLFLTENYHIIYWPNNITDLLAIVPVF